MSFLKKTAQLIQRVGFVPVRPYQTTAPIVDALKENTPSNILGWKPLASLLYAIPSFRQQHTRFDTNERIIEIPWVFSQLDFKKKGKVLDIGWLESTVAVSLATAGFEVTGVDLRAGELHHPNLTSIAGDICKTSFAANTFDYVILLSTLEHIGLDTTYGSVEESSTDQKAINECLRVLKPGGKLLLTTPVAKRSHQDSFMRWYTTAGLKKMLSAWNSVTSSYYVPSKDRQYWKESSAKALPEPPAFGVALVTAEKPKTKRTS